METRKKASNNRFSKLLFLALVPILLTVAEPDAHADDPAWVTKYVPADLVPFASNAVGIAGAYSDITNAVEVTQKLGEIVGIFKKEPDKFAQLAAHIDVAISKVLWRVDGLDRANRLATEITAVNRAAMEAGADMPIDSTTAFNSANMVTQAMQDIHFQRIFNESATDGHWKKLFRRRPSAPVHDDFVDGHAVKIVYDWRIGVPTLMQLIALRVQVIAAQDPHLRERPTPFAADLLDYAAALEEHYKTMEDGVICTRSRYFDDGFLGQENGGAEHWENYCADVYTGLSVTTKTSPLHINDENDLQKNFWNISDLRGQLMAKMPFLEMAQMIRTLKQLASPNAQVVTQCLKVQSPKPPRETYSAPLFVEPTYQAVWRLGSRNETLLVEASWDQFLAKDRQLRPQGWRLHQIHTNVACNG